MAAAAHAATAAPGLLRIMTRPYHAVPRSTSCYIISSHFHACTSAYLDAWHV